MKTVGIRELKQNPSQVINWVEQGNQVQITVQGRPTAILMPIVPTRRRTVLFSELQTALTANPLDRQWAEDAYRDRDDDPVTNPWGER
ncbi:MAG: type II toxin-antitoxin system Phd/YefM family antitoxin [Microbacteriaceae bacterium]